MFVYEFILDFEIYSQLHQTEQNPPDKEVVSNDFVKASFSKKKSTVTHHWPVISVEVANVMHVFGNSIKKILLL